MAGVNETESSAQLKSIPGPKGVNPLTYTLNMQKDPLIYLKQIQEEFGDVVQLPFPFKPVYFIADPDLVGKILLGTEKNNTKSIGYQRIHMLLGDGLLTSTGKIWAQQRKLANPAFHNKMLATLVQVMREESEKLCQRLKKEIGTGSKVDISREMSRLTFTIIGRILFSLDLSSKADIVKDSLKVIQDYAGYLFYAIIPMPLMVPTPSNLRAKKALRQMNEVVYQIIAEHRNHPEQYQDLLSVYINSVDDEGQHMADKLIRDEAVTLMLAGHDTTAVSVSLALWEAAKNEKVADQLFAESESLPPDYQMKEALGLDFTNRVFQEITRLYPAAWAVGREPMKDVTYGDFFFPKGSQMIISQYHTQRNPRFWKEPDRFDPDRFLSENLRGQHPFAHFAFGGGQRTCIGSNLAKLEANIILSTLSKHFTFSWDSHDEFQLVPKISMTIEPRLKLILKPR